MATILCKSSVGKFSIDFVYTCIIVTLPFVVFILRFEAEVAASTYQSQSQPVGSHYHPQQQPPSYFSRSCTVRLPTSFSPETTTTRSDSPCFLSTLWLSKVPQLLTQPLQRDSHLLTQSLPHLLTQSPPMGLPATCSWSSSIIN